MRIRTLLGPPLTQEIVRDTATALALSMYTDTRADADPSGGRTSAAGLGALLTAREHTTHQR